MVLASNQRRSQKVYCLDSGEDLDSSSAPLTENLEKIQHTFARLWSFDEEGVGLVGRAPSRTEPAVGPADRPGCEFNEPEPVENLELDAPDTSRLVLVDGTGVGAREFGEPAVAAVNVVPFARDDEEDIGGWPCVRAPGAATAGADIVSDDVPGHNERREV